MKKAKKIIGISLIVLVLLFAIVGILYLKTDLLDFLKKPKTLFYTYLMQNKEGLAEFNNSANEDITQKMQNESYEENGEMTWNIEALTPVDVETQKGFEILNNANITYNTKANLKDNKISSKAYIKYKNEDLATLEAIFTNQAFGLKVGEIYDKCIAIENNNLKELAERFGIDSTSIPDKIELNKQLNIEKLSEEDLKSVKERYLNVLNESIEEENYTRSKETIEINGEEINTKAYTLTLSQKETKKLIINLLEALKDDDILLNYFVNYINKVNEITYGTEYEQLRKTDLKMMISYITASMNDASSTSKDKLYITVYESKGKTVRTKISIADVALILDREQDGQNTNMKISFIDGKQEFLTINVTVKNEKENNEINASLYVEDFKMGINFKGNKDLTDNSFEISLETKDMRMKINDTRKVEYKNVNIDDGVLSNAEELNDKTDEELNDLFTKIQDNAIKFAEELQNKFITE